MGARERGTSHPALATLTAGMAVLALVLGLAALLVLSGGASVASAAEGTGAIAGTVKSASSHEPLRGIEVNVYEASGSQFLASWTTTNANGEYEVKGLRGGSYEVEFTPGFGGEGGNYVPQFYREAATLAAANRVAVSEGATTHEIDAELLTGGKLKGTVTEAEGGAAAANILVRVLLSEPGGPRTVGVAATDAAGHYTVEGLESGSYEVEFSPGFEGVPFGGFEEEEVSPFPEGVSGRNLVAQYYKGASSPAGATAVHVVREASTEGIDAQMLRGAEIEGTVTDASTHAPHQGAWVVAQGPGETFAAVVSTDRNGHYVLAGLESGSYVVSFEAPRYLGQFYSGQPTFALASPVAVTRPLTTAGIDAALVPKAPANTAAPVASGTPAVGQTLSCARGTWTGSPAPSYAYAWLRDGVPIPGATATTYAVQPADQGNGVTCKVTATNRNGSAAAISNTLIVPVPSPPPPPPPPPPALHLASSRVAVRGAVARVELRCTGSPCRGALELVERLAIKHAHRHALHETVILGHAAYALEAGQTATVVVKLDGRARHALARAPHHRLHAEVMATVGSGVIAKLAVLLSAARHR